jgi:hypothetical protein
MGLDTSHGCWHGSYSAFNRWRMRLAEVVGIPLPLMEGYYRSGSFWVGGGEPPYAVEEAMRFLPVKWGTLKPSPLHVLLNHSDCDGWIPAAECAPLADAMAALLPLLDGDGGGHVGSYREKTQEFINGLRLAAERGENVEFR